MSDRTHSRALFILAGRLINLGQIIACWLLLVGTPTELEGEPLRPVNTDPVEAE